MKSRSRNARSGLNEWQTVDLLWRIIGQKGAGDPFSDDVTWFKNCSGKLVVFKADMLVSSTDAPRQMTPKEIGSKAIVACVSDFAAKGVQPSFAVVSFAIPRSKSNNRFLTGLARGFKLAETSYGLKILGGDTGESKSEVIVDCSMIGFADRVIKRAGAHVGDLIGTTGYFGLQSSGLKILLGQGKKMSLPSQNFRDAATKSVLNPRAKLDLGLKIARYATSSIDSSDGLALSLYLLAESSKVDFLLDQIPMAPGVEGFAKLNSLDASSLALFGGEEYELVFTFPKNYEKQVKKLGVKVIGKVLRKTPLGNRSKVFSRSRVVPRKGYVHNRT